MSANKTITLLTASSLAIAVAQANAQDTNTDELVVIGEKRERSLQDTNASVVIFNENTIREQNLLDLGDALELVAGVVTTQEGRGYSIRGANVTFAQTVDAGIVNNAPLASIFVDGVEIPPYQLQGGPTRAWDVAQVEVFRGPQSTVLGRNTLAGAIVVKTADPEFEFGAKARVQIAELGRRLYSGVVNVPFSDSLAARFVVEYNEQDGAISNEFLGIDDQDFMESLSLRGKLLFQPENSPFSALLTVNYVDAEEGFGGVFDEENRCSGPTGQVSPCVLNADPFQRLGWSNTPVRDERETQSVILELNYDLSGRWALKSITGYSYTELLGLKDHDNGPILFEIDRRDRDERAFTQELRVNYDGDQLSGVMGAFFYRSDFFLQNAVELGDIFLPRTGFPAGVPAGFQLIPSAEDAFYTNPAVGLPAALVPALNAVTPAAIEVQTGNDNDYLNTNFALFADFDYTLTPRLTVTAGGRFDYQEFEYDVSNIFSQLNQADVDAYLADVTAVLNGAPGFPGALVPVTVGALEANYINAIFSAVAPELGSDEDQSGTGDNVAFLPKAGLTYALTDDASVAFKIQRGYRTGGISYQPSTGLLELYDPEFTWNYELALRTAWLEDRLFVNANAYFISWKDQQVVFLEDLTDPFSSRTINAGESEAYGFELELLASPADGLTLGGAVAYNKTEFIDFDTGTQNFSGNPFALSPEWTASVQAVYEHPSGLFISANGSYVDDRFQFERASNFLGSYFLTNMQAGYRADNFTLSVFVNNVFDEEYLTQNRSFVFSTVGDPRVVGGSILVEF